MVIGLCEITLRLPGVLSLKAKRSLLKSLIARLRQRFNVSVAEVDEHDKWQLSVIAVACVSTDSVQAHRLLEQVLHFTERDTQIQVIQSSSQIF